MQVTCIWPVSKLVVVLVCWFPREVGSVCDKCTEGRVLLQYASNSSSPRPCAPSGHWSPREAEGTLHSYMVHIQVIRFQWRPTSCTVLWQMKLQMLYSPLFLAVYQMSVLSQYLDCKKLQKLFLLKANPLQKRHPPFHRRLTIR